MYQKSAKKPKRLQVPGCIIANSETYFVNSEKGESWESYSLLSLIHIVTVFPIFCLKAALNVL